MVLANRFLQRLQWRQSRRFLLTLDLPATQGALHLPDSVLRFHAADHRDHHPSRAIMLTMKLHKIITLDPGDGFRKPIFGAAVGMTLEEDVVKNHGCHIPRVLGAD